MAETKLNKNYALSTLYAGILAMVFSIFIWGFFIFAAILICLGVFMGIMSLYKLKKEPAKYGGKKITWIGIIIVLASIVVFVLGWMGLAYH